MTRILSTYVNYSLGGMTSVYRARCLTQPDVHFDHVFEVDRGGIGTLEDLPNGSARIAPRNRRLDYLRHAMSFLDYEELRITSAPDIANSIGVDSSRKIVYEFHSSSVSVVQKELALLNPMMVDEIWVPSSWSADFVHSHLPRRKHINVKVVPNIIDVGTFHNGPGDAASGLANSGIPVSWIGRLENNQKNYLDFLRVLRNLPGEYYGLMIISYEAAPDRLERFLGDAASHGVANRIKLYSNVPQTEMGRVHRAVRDAGGVFISTALEESFGYTVVEAASCGCPVVSYDVGPLAQHRAPGIRLIPVGDLAGVVANVLEHSR